MEPTDKSIWRMTMMSTMPVLMTEIDEVWTSRFQRFRGFMNTASPVSNCPKIWKPIQMSASAATMPSRRVSISVARETRLTGLSIATRWAVLGSAPTDIAFSPKQFIGTKQLFATGGGHADKGRAMRPAQVQRVSRKP